MFIFTFSIILIILTILYTNYIEIYSIIGLLYLSYSLNNLLYQKNYIKIK